MKRTIDSGLYLLMCFILMGGLSATPAQPQTQTENCVDTPEGLLCTSTQELRHGVFVPVPRQQELGLVTVGGGCSGTFVNRFWVLTADHCGATDGRVGGPSAALTALPISAAWPTRTPIPTRLVRNWFDADLDVARIALGAGHFGQANTQLFHGGELENGMMLTEGSNPCLDRRSETACVGTVVQRRADGTLWRWNSYTPCTGTVCPGWRRLDINSQTQEIAAGPFMLYKRHADGSLWNLSSRDVCFRSSPCPGWVRIDMNPQTREIAAGFDTLYQRHADGKLWKWDGHTPCTGTVCPGWTLIDRNPRTRAMAAGGTPQLFQRHVDGSLWKWDGLTPCTGTACPGWTLIDRNPRTRAMAVGGNTLFQRHVDGSLWKWDGHTPCTGTACPGWMRIDMNPQTQEIAAGFDTLYQRHADGELWKWDGHTPCTGTACPGWILIDRNPRTRAVAAGPTTLFQRHVDGSVWKWDGRTPCTGTACPGWMRIDMDPRTQAIVPFGPLWLGDPSIGT